MTDHEAAARARARMEAATVLHPPRTPAWHAEYALLGLRELADRGLPACYGDLEAFLTDWWPDLPWTADGQAEAARLILADPRFPAIRAAVLAEYGLDLADELDLTD